MKTRIATLLSALTLLTVSCEQDPNAGSVWEDPKFVRIVAPTEMVKSGNTEIELFYKEGQLIKVWDQAGNAVDLNINKDKDSVFFAYEWIPDAVPAYAAFPASEEATCLSDGLLSLTLESQQKVSAPENIENFFAVGKVTGANRTSYKVSPLKNVTGFISLQLDSPLIASITLESVSGEPMSGDMIVDCAKLAEGKNDFFTVPEASGSNSVTIVPSEADATLTAGTYYVALLPGTYSKGIKVIVDIKYGTPIVKTFFENGLTVKRSNLSVLNDDATIGYELPDEIRIDLNFAEGWPFVEPIVSGDAQSGSGDSYSYLCRYELDGVENVQPVDFLIKGNKQKYMHDKTLQFDEFSRVRFPVLPGMYLRAVKYVAENNTDSGQQGIRLYASNMGNVIYKCPDYASKGSPVIMSFPTKDGKKTECETGYWLSFFDEKASEGALISNLSLLYSKELPSSYDDNPFGDVVPESDLPENFSITLDFAAGWPFNEPCAAKEAQVVTGEKYTYTYSYDNGQKTQTMDFFITKGGMAKDYSYEYVDNALFFDSEISAKNSTAMIALPVVQGRYLTEVRAVHNGDPWVQSGKNYYPRFNLQMGFLNAPGTGLDTSKGFTYNRADPGVETVMTLPFTMSDNKTVVNSALGQIYAVRMRDNDLRLTKLVISYSKTRPE